MSRAYPEYFLYFCGVPSLWTYFILIGMKKIEVIGIPTILVTMNKFRDRNNLQIENALRENRILILVLSYFDCRPCRLRLCKP